MFTPTLCAQVARRLGEPLGVITRRGFQPVAQAKKSPGRKLSAVDCPFCGQQVLVAGRGPVIEAECRGCDTAFSATPDDVYSVALDDAERPRVRRFHHENS